ncbi:MAG: biopolymer transporter ExbD [Vicinamibacteria bacterium]
MSGRGKGALNSNINVTPLVDVMLVLLIIFMVITPMLQKGIDVKLPVAEYPIDHPDDESVVTLAVTRDRTLHLDMLQVPKAELEAKIREKFDTRAEKVLFLKADESLEYGTVLEVMDIVRDGGVEEIALITDVKAGAGGR